MAVNGSTILIFMRGSKSFDTHLMEKAPRHLIRIVFWSAPGSDWPKWQKKAKFGRLCAKNPNFYGSKKKFWYPHNVKTT